MAKRAFAAEDKLARRRVMLQAAARLFAAGGGELPPVAEIARAAGLAKGTVYLYFRTKEEIFSALLLEGWGEAVDLVEAEFVQARPVAGRVSAFLARYVAHVDAHRELLRLDALGHGVLMKNLEPAVLAAFKAELAARIEAGGAEVERALALPPGRGARLLTRTYGLTRGLWQSYDESVAFGDALGQYASGFAAELAEALREYWRGALAEADDGRRT